MKRGILFFIFLCVLIAIFLLGNKPTSHTDATEQLQRTSTSTPKANPNQKTIIINDQSYGYDRIGPINPQQVTLLSNLPTKKSSTTLKTDNACSEMTSAGFYNTNDKHIGLFVVDDVIIQEQSQNNLFNSYVWATQDSAGIGQLLPDQQLLFALQTGPSLIHENQPRKLTLTVDEQARRLAVGVTEANTFVFYVVHSESNTFIGPTLVDLPNIIQAINTQEQLTVPEVVNLDGGNHSTFQSKTTTITELSPVGGIFCIK